MDKPLLGDEDVERLDRICASIREHYDSVRIFVTKDGRGIDRNTASLDRGAGNYYSALGQIGAWVDKERGYWGRIGVSEAEDDLGKQE